MMTPERKEEIKRKITTREFWSLGIAEHTQIVDELWATLEETQQQLQRTQITSSVHEGNSDAYFAECERLRRELAEAQQTITRQREALKRISDLHIRGIEDRACEPLRQIASEALKGSDNA